MLAARAPPAQARRAARCAGRRERGRAGGWGACQPFLCSTQARMELWESGTFSPTSLFAWMSNCQHAAGNDVRSGQRRIHGTAGVSPVSVRKRLGRADVAGGEPSPPLPASGAQPLRPRHKHHRNARPRERAHRVAAERCDEVRVRPLRVRAGRRARALHDHRPPRLLRRSQPLRAASLGVRRPRGRARQRAAPRGAGIGFSRACMRAGGPCSDLDTYLRRARPRVRRRRDGTGPVYGVQEGVRVLRGSVSGSQR